MSWRWLCKEKAGCRTGAIESYFEENNAVTDSSVEGGNEEIEDDKADRLCNTNEEESSDAKFSEKREDNKAKSISDMDRFRCVDPMGAKRCSDAKFPEKHKDDKGKSTMILTSSDAQMLAFLLELTHENIL